MTFSLGYQYVSTPQNLQHVHVINDIVIDVYVF